MIVCVAGMHRSGTSMVAQVLQSMGVYLGPPDMLLAASPSNPRGYWENIAFITINDAILVTNGGSWSNPPKTIDLHRVGYLSDTVNILLHHFSSCDLWGWKDPRNCLTLPFWLSLIPDLKLVICFRHPTPAAKSLQRSQQMPYQQALSLWQQYNERVLGYLNQACVLDYDRCLASPEEMIQRLRTHLNHQSGSSDKLVIDDIIARSMRHYQPTEHDTEQLPDDIRRTLWLLQRASL